jgi:hypothetical protein
MEMSQQKGDSISVVAEQIARRRNHFAAVDAPKVLEHS